MITMKKKVLALILSLTLILGVAIGRLSSQPESKTPGLSTMLRMFSYVLTIVQRKYVEPMDPSDLVVKAIKGMVSSLDPFSVFMEPEAAENFKIHTSGKFGGVGMTVGIRDGYLTVISPIEGTPAEKAGLRAGDRIIKIDGQPTWNLTINEAVEKIRGKPGTKVTLTILRPGFTEPFDVELTRAIITIHPVTYHHLFNGDIGYIRFVTFSENSSAELISVIDSLKKQGAKKFILDLRSNPGGHLREAVRVADIFLRKGDLIVFTRGRNPSDNSRYYAQRPPIVDTTAPIVVLVDGGTASASEIVSGAIQDWDRGIIIGDTTVGKGSVQRLFPVGNGYMLKLTVARYYTPSGRCIDRITWNKQRSAPRITVPDSIKAKQDSAAKDTTDTLIYYTKILKRKVIGGGGIIPDIIIENEKALPIVVRLVAKGLFFKYAVKYCEDHPEPPKSFDDLKITDATIEDFKKFIQDNGFEFRNSEFEEAKEQIRKKLAMDIAEDYWGSKGRYGISLKYDRVFHKALNLLQKANTRNDLFDNLREK